MAVGSAVVLIFDDRFIPMVCTYYWPMKPADATGSALSLRLVRGHAISAAMIWFAAHVFLAIADGEPSGLGLRATMFLVATAVLVSMFTAHRRRETGFLGNLGVPATIPAIVSAVTVIALELFTASIVAGIP